MLVTYHSFLDMSLEGMPEEFIKGQRHHSRWLKHVMLAGLCAHVVTLVSMA